LKKQVCCLLLGISVLCLPAQQVFAAPPSPAGPAAQAEEKAEEKKPHEKPKPHEKVKPHEAKKLKEEKKTPGPLGEKPVPLEPKEKPVPPEPKEKPVPPELKEKPVPPHEKNEEKVKQAVTEQLPVAEQTVSVPTVAAPKEEVNSNSSQNSSGVTEQENVKNNQETETVETKKDVINSSLRQEVVNYALRFVGNPYKWGGTSLTNGADCSGFVWSVYAHFNYSLSRTSRGQAGSTEYAEVALKESELLPGDLIFYANSNGVVYHVALYIGDGRIVHAANSNEGITISKYTYMRPYKARRIIEA